MKKRMMLLLTMLLIVSTACAQAASIRLGSTGRDVEDLQKMLSELGYYSGNISGHAGEKTIEAIEEFQEKNGLKKDGIAGTATINKIRSIIDPSYRPSSSSQAGNSDVEMAQAVLKKMGLYSGDITGNIGSKTTAAIKAFQKKHGLDQSGALDSATLAKLQSVNAGENKTESAEQESADESDVRAAQAMLKEMDLYYGEITGNVGSKTKAAIKAFQKKYGLEESGVLNLQTMAKLQSVYAGENMPEVSEPAEPENAGAEDVKKAQMMLEAMDLYYGEITGNIGTKTKAAIKKFQNKYGLAADGILSAETLARIEWVYSGGNEAPEDETQEEVVEEIFTSLRFGSTGTNVSILQESLTRLGYYYGDVTGSYGTKTRAAVRSFQKANSLTADGIAGKKTFSAVLAAVEKLGLPDIEEGTEETGGNVLDFHWFNEKSFYNNHGVKKGLTMTVMDIVTGKMFNVRVQSTGYHADVEPKTAADTQIMCDIYGVSDSSQINWKRRAILVKTNMGGGNIYTYAASMYGEPHGSQVITDNNFDGQFCIHFRHSTTSESKIEYADNQSPIDKAVNYAVSKMGMRHVTDPSQL